LIFIGEYILRSPGGAGIQSARIYRRLHERNGGTGARMRAVVVAVERYRGLRQSGIRVMLLHRDSGRPDPR